MPKRAAAIAAVLAAIAATPATAAAAPCEADAAARADAIRAHLDQEVHRARWWDVSWGVGFGVVAIGYGAMAETRWELGIELDDHKVDDLWVSAGKAGIASLSHAVLPIRIERAPAATGDPCRDLAAAEDALRTSARHESAAFWLSIAGGVVLNGGALLLLGMKYGAWTEGAISTGIGLPVAAIHAWTAPHGSRRAVSEGRFDGPAATWRLDALRSPGFTGLVLSGSF